MDLKLIKNLLNMIAESDVAGLHRREFQDQGKKQSEAPAFNPQPMFPPVGTPLGAN